MTSVKLINHSSSTADWNKYIIYLYTLSQSVYTENFVASFSRSMVTSRSIIGGVTFA